MTVFLLVLDKPILGCWIATSHNGCVHDDFHYIYHSPKHLFNLWPQTSHPILADGFSLAHTEKGFILWNESIMLWFYKVHPLSFKLHATHLINLSADFSSLVKMFTLFPFSYIFLHSFHYDFLEMDFLGLEWSEELSV